MNAVILPYSMLLYIVLPAWMLGRGWLIRAGVEMIAAALLPWAVWGLEKDDHWPPGAGIALMATAAMLIVAPVPIALGTARTVLPHARARSKAGT